MKLFLIERKLPGAGNMTVDELRAISQTSVSIVNNLGKPYKWLQSFVTEDAIYCLHEAENEAMVREHAARCHFPIHVVEEVQVVIGPETANYRKD